MKGITINAGFLYPRVGINGRITGATLLYPFYTYVRPGISSLII